MKDATLGACPGHRHPSVISGRHGGHQHRVHGQTGPAGPLGAPSAAAAATAMDDAALGLAAAAPATGGGSRRSVRHVTTWTSQRGTEPSRCYVSWHKWSQQRRPRLGAPSRAVLPVFLGRTMDKEDREAQGTCFAPDPGAMYCGVCGTLHLHEVHERWRYHRDRVRGATPSANPAPTDLHAALDQPGAVEAVLAYMTQRQGFLAAVLEGSLLQLPATAAVPAETGDVLSAGAATSTAGSTPTGESRACLPSGRLCGRVVDWTPGNGSSRGLSSSDRR
ncbi:hypothetical protein ISCGN_027164 [Ixodes scapularis]